MNQAIVIDRPFLEIKEALHNHSRTQGYEKLKEFGFEVGWFMPEQNGNYMTPLENARNEGILNDDAIDLCKNDFSNYLKILSDNPDSLVVVDRSPNFDFNLGIESELYCHIMDAGYNVHFFPEFAPRGLNERSGFYGWSDTSIVDVAKRSKFLESNLDGTANFLFIGTEPKDMVYFAATQYSNFMDLPAEIFSLRRTGNLKKEIKQDMEMGIYGGHTLEDFVITEDIS